MQLIENLYRAELTALQHAEDLAALIELCQNDKGGQLAHPGGKQPHDHGVSRAAKALGFSRREVRRSLQIAKITIEAKSKAVEVGFDKKQSRLLTIAKEDGAEAQLAKIDEIMEARTSRPKAPPSGKMKAKKKGSNSPPIVPEPGDQSELDQQDPDDLADSDDSEEENNGQSDWDQQDSEADSDDSEEEERLFSALKAAWETAPQSVRKRFVKKVLHLALDQIEDEIFAA